ncbi:MAG TPA: GTP cyclohydrolase I FolE, partial [Chloroflexota bacterium]|nr:GTP cyclohydrolase I FolE [Chloroflexota bacterium]
MISVGVDTQRLAQAAGQILEAIGDDPSREGLRETPLRMARMYAELFEGLHMDPAATLSTVFHENHREMVIVRDIPFYSMCEHHLLPFHGVAHFGYLPDGRVVGLSKIARLVDCLSRRPQVQERLAGQVVDTFCEVLHPLGCGVVIQAEHLCMTMRGVRKPGSKMVTSALRGVFRDLPETRAEFLANVR